MAPRGTYRTKAIVVDRRTRLKEQDLILVLLAEDGSEKSVVAKGALKPGGRLAARVDFFGETDFLLARGRSLDVVAEASSTNAHLAIRGDLARMSAASAICEVARLTCFADVRDPFLYPICSRALRACEEAGDQGHLDLVAAAYALKVLAHGGWRPELRFCTSCGDEDVAFFSVASGGMLCASCAKDVAGAREMGRSGRLWLAALLQSTFDELLSAPIDVGTSTELVSLVHVWCATHLDARLRAFEFMLSM
ncbi:DNA repair protein RecO [Olsenella uli]|uniref:DNA repair protein RecO n=1 Tax=Olsenella uli TaxID=133926 RepID=UPI0028E568CE|nr:DNA repair protein RecO [Olsenella uli]